METLRSVFCITAGLPSKLYDTAFSISDIVLFDLTGWPQLALRDCRKCIFFPVDSYKQTWLKFQESVLFWFLLLRWYSILKDKLFTPAYSLFTQTPCVNCLLLLSYIQYAPKSEPLKSNVVTSWALISWTLDNKCSLLSRPAVVFMIKWPNINPKWDIEA